jgi:hypothetical protein
MKRVATIILNRNLPEVTDSLYNHLIRYDHSETDIFIVEAGSDPDKLSRHVTWYADWPEAKLQGLRYARGMNYGLSQLWKSNKFYDYEAFFLLTNDTELEKKPSISRLMNVLDEHPRIGILSPCSMTWGERLLLQKERTKYFWFIHNNSYLLRREFIESIMNKNKVDYSGFVFDGQNFRGYLSESELVAKAYANDWAAAITSEVMSSENESYLITQADVIKTESYEDNLQLYIREGLAWAHEKYGFNSRWSMQQYAKSFYDSFFQFHPEFKIYKI